MKLELTLSCRKNSSVFFLTVGVVPCLFLRFKPRLPDSPSEDDVVCTGGDNSYGLIITEPDGQQQISVNDSIIGRRSHPFISMVKNIFYYFIKSIKMKLIHPFLITHAKVVAPRQSLRSR